MEPESRWWRPKNDVPVEVDVPVDEVDEFGLEEALPGIVSAAVMAKMPSAATAPTATQLVNSLSRPIPASRALIRVSVESMILIKPCQARLRAT